MRPHCRDRLAGYKVPRHVVFGEVPTKFVFIGATIIALAGLFVIWRERHLGLRRIREAEGPPTGA